MTSFQFAYDWGVSRDMRLFSAQIGKIQANGNIGHWSIAIDNNVSISLTAWDSSVVSVLIVCLFHCELPE